MTTESYGFGGIVAGVVLAAVLAPPAAGQPKAQSGSPGKAAAGAYPAKPIRLVVPVAPGGSTDVVARILAPRLVEALGEQIIVDNRSGAGGIIGSELVARATPDGHTLLLAYASHTTAPFLLERVPFDPVRDFTAVSLVSMQSLLVVVHPSVPAGTIAELVAMARAKPGALRYGVATTGSAGHLAGEMFKQATGTDLTPVVYRGGGPTQLALLAGEVQVVFASTLSALPQVKAHKVKVLATTSGRRLGYLPDVPTLAESGMPGFEVAPWQGLLGPARLPQPVVERLHRELVAVLRLPDTVDRLAATGSDPVGSTPAEFAAQIRRELDQFGRIIRSAGIRVQ